MFVDSFFRQNKMDIIKVFMKLITWKYDFYALNILANYWPKHVVMEKRNKLNELTFALLNKINLIHCCVVTEPINADCYN